MDFKITKNEAFRTNGPVPVAAADLTPDKTTGAPVTTYTTLAMRRGALAIKVKVPGPPVITNDEIAAILENEGFPPLINFSEDFEASFYALAGKNGVISGISAKASAATLAPAKGGQTK